MRHLLPGLAVPLAAVAFSAAPVEAQSFTDQGFATRSPMAEAPHGSPGWRSGETNACRDMRGSHHGDGSRRSGCGDYLGAWTWYQPDINRSWASDSFNDWWHDRPDRAYPAWVRHNENCSEDRMWWSGSGWHC